jgi:4-hydroxy-tetrahydrodipicolinate synthase
VDLLFVETNPAPGKWVLEQRGLIASGHVRPPLITPSEAGVARIKDFMAEGEKYLTPTEGFTVEGKS